MPYQQTVTETLVVALGIATLKGWGLLLFPKKHRSGGGATPVSKIEAKLKAIQLGEIQVEVQFDQDQVIRFRSRVVAEK